MSFFKSFIPLVFAILSIVLYGCKVEPLYRQVSQVSTTGNTVDSFSYTHSLGKNSLGLAEKLASIVVEESSDRFDQMVRNHLQFLLYGSGSKPSTSVYKLKLQTSTFTRESMQIEVGLEKNGSGRASVGTVVSKASYVLTDMKNTSVAKGMGTVSVSFERLRQEYATTQAKENAQKRAAEELAEQIFMLLSKDLSKH
ncbi:LPS assembly lipoprotein LptE [Bartonella sp. CB169]|uniref:LPS assembly lipoprotein LptE n=1 Tax=Bartonella sp. CB169 TaxID=3112257 RepID=UPI00300DEFC6